MEEELQKQAEGILGNWVWLFVSGVALLLFKSTIETVVEGVKVFMGKDLNTDDVVILDGAYDIGMADGKPYVKGGTKIQIQNDKLKEHVIERPLQMLDLSKWEEK